MPNGIPTNPLPVAIGGTGASSAAAARSSLGAAAIAGGNSFTGSQTFAGPVAITAAANVRLGNAIIDQETYGPADALLYHYQTANPATGYAIAFNAAGQIAFNGSQSVFLRIAGVTKIDINAAGVAFDLPPLFNFRPRLSASLTKYADNATALAGGLTAGEVYVTAAGDFRVVV